MPTIVVEVMPKAELLDPQGKAVAGALTRLGESRFTGVRIGKRFELVTDGPVDDALLSDVQKLAEELLANSVIEDVVGVKMLETGLVPPIPNFREVDPELGPLSGRHSSVRG